MASLYILYSNYLDKYYVGFTEGNAIIRLNKHLADHMGFTAKAKDWKIAYSELFETKDLAYKRERQIKKWKSRKLIENLISKDS